MSNLTRRALLGTLASSAATVAFPGVVTAACSNTNSRNCVSLQVVAMAYNASFASKTIKRSRNDRVFKTGQEMFDGLASRKFKKPKRDIPVFVMFWMKSGFERKQAVHDNVNGMREFRLDRINMSNIQSGISKRSAQFHRQFDSMPTISNSLNSRPKLAVTTILSDYGVGWGLSYDFLRQVEAIMICPRADTVWPRRQNGAREGLIITRQEIEGWIRRGESYAIAGIIDSV